MLASSSRNALKTAHTRLSGIATDLCSAQQAQVVTFGWSRCAQQQRHESSAQVRTQQNIFHERDGRARRHGGLRNQPYQFTPDVDFRGTTVMTEVARYNLKLSRFIEGSLTRVVMRVCLQMKNKGLRPNLTTYTYIMQACGIEGSYDMARATLEDMVSMDIRPDREIFHYLLNAARYQDSRKLWEVISMMERFDIRPNESTYEYIILQYAESGNLELALQYLSALGMRGLSPTLKTAQGIIRVAGSMGFPRLALDLAEAFEQTSVRRLDGEVWAECLESSSEALYEEGVLRTWQKVVHELNITPDEGCCIQVLHTAARHGLSGLGLDVLRVLSRIGVAWQEYHFAPVIEAFCKDNKIKDAMEMLAMIRAHGINPISETAYPIFQMIQKDPDTVDEAWGYLETLREEGKVVDVTALNVIIQASVGIGDLQRAVGTYKAAGDLGVAPNVDSYNLLLSGCIVSQHRELGDRLLGEMKDASIKPDVRTYERLIVLCLTQANYEDAFFYLEEMKNEGHLPPVTVYEAIIRKCVQVGDTRYQLAVDEMVECGYEMSEKLEKLIQSGGENEGSEGTPDPVARSERRRGAWLQDTRRGQE
ncbi:hypothetical protein BKA93DRAFT_780560 [Sparassis latifolia]